LALGLAAAMNAGAAAYRCQGADGKVSYSDRPCEVGQHVAGKVDGNGLRVLARAEPGVSASAAAPAAAPASAALGKPAPGAGLAGCKAVISASQAPGQTLAAGSTGASCAPVR
jgi:hypothetical protein